MRDGGGKNRKNEREIPVHTHTRARTYKHNIGDGKNDGDWCVTKCPTRSAYDAANYAPHTYHTEYTEYDGLFERHRTCFEMFFRQLTRTSETGIDSLRVENGQTNFNWSSSSFAIRV